MEIVSPVYMLNSFITQECFHMQVTRNPASVAYTNMNLFFFFIREIWKLAGAVLVQRLSIVKANISEISLAVLTSAVETGRRRKEIGRHKYQKSESFPRHSTDFHSHVDHRAPLAGQWEWE